MMLKRWLTVALALLLTLPAAQAMAAETTGIGVSFAPLHYVVDGTEYQPPEDQLGFILVEQGRAYVSLRFVANILNKYVHWDGQTYTVTVSDPEAKDWAEIRKNLDQFRLPESVIEPVEAGTVQTGTIEVSPADVTYVFNGETVVADSLTPGFIYNGRIYVPLSFVYSSLGYTPDWDGGTYTISTTTDAARLEYETIVKAADVELRELENVCKQDMLRWYLPFNAKVDSYTDEQIRAEVEKVTEIFNSCKADVRDLLDGLAAKLAAGQHSTAVVDEYWLIFDELENMGKGFLADYLDGE